MTVRVESYDTPKAHREETTQLANNAPRDENQTSFFDEVEEATAAEFSTGILAAQHIDELLARKWLQVSSPLDPDQVQPASIDLRLGKIAYEVSASFLPGRNSRVSSRIQDLLIREVSLTPSAVLQRNSIYIIPLQERLALPENHWGRANPKSTTGRLDILTRLITDYSDEFESVPRGYKGDLFVEVVPRTFNVRVKEGTRLSQLRFVRGAPRPADTQVRRLHSQMGVVFSYDREKPDAPEIDRGGIWVSVDLAPRDQSGLVGYKAKHVSREIDLARVNHYEPLDFWEPVTVYARRHMVLDPGEFYILVSKERISIPPSVAAEMVAYDPSVGEFRIHYAGFFDPGFGHGPGMHGTPAVLEVRSHEVPFVLEDGQSVARLVYERLLSPPTLLYGSAIGSSYQGQGLALSKHFRRMSGA